MQHEKEEEEVNDHKLSIPGLSLFLYQEEMATGDQLFRFTRTDLLNLHPLHTPTCKVERK